ncbi:MAG TPA: hypothetical protein VKT32_02035, partial [Chthonomonadaceae bacterium]|nr:hypothetical protein [Chthonomonadaceae bacterium]
MVLGILPAVQGAAMEKGLQDGWAVDNDDRALLTDAVAQEMRAAGARWVRLDFRLNARHMTWDDRLLSAYAQVVASLQRAHLSVLGLVGNEAWPGAQADWIAGNAEVAGGSGDNAYLRDLAGIAFHRLLRRFPSVRVWEMWNEPNAWTRNAPGHAEKLPGGSYLYPSNFAWLLRHAFEESRALPHPVTIVSGGVLAADFTDDLDANLAAPYLRATWRAGRTLAGWDGLREQFHSWPLDGWGLHLYLKVGSRIRPAEFTPYPAAFARLRDDMEGGRSTKPIWITEIGWATPPGEGHLSEADQAANVTAALESLRRLPAIGPVLWFTLHDNPAAALYYGLRRADDSPKPAWTAFLKG